MVHVCAGQVVAVKRTAVLVIRAWLEASEHSQMRARITESLDIASGDRTENAAAGEEEILAAVAEWLRRFAERR